MDVSIEIYELKVLEFGYYVLQVSAENATNNWNITSQLHPLWRGLSPVANYLSDAHVIALTRDQLLRDGRSSVGEATSAYS